MSLRDTRARRNTEASFLRRSSAFPGLLASLAIRQQERRSRTLTTPFLRAVATTLGGSQFPGAPSPISSGGERLPGLSTPAPWHIPFSSVPHGRSSSPEQLGYWEYAGGDPAQDAAWEWIENVKGPYFVADRRLVEAKARMGQQLVEGLSYSRAALDQEALERVISWGYPATPEAWAAWEAEVGPYIADYYRTVTPEALIGSSVASPVYWATTKQYLLPGMPPASQIGVPIVRSYP